VVGGDGAVWKLVALLELLDAMRSVRAVCTAVYSAVQELVHKVG